MQPAAANMATGPAPTTSQPAVEAYNAGVEAFKSKDYKTAEAKFEEATKNDPKLTLAWEGLAAAAFRAGDMQKSADAAEEAIKLGSTDEVLLTNRWEAYKNLKNEEKAQQALQDLQSIGRRAEEAKKLHNEAVELEKAGNNEAAFAKFQEALKVDPNLQASLIGVATTGFEIGKYEEAATAAETVLKLDPGNENALRLRYNAALKLGDKDRLFDALVGLAKVQPDVAVNGLMNLAFEAYDAGDMPTAKTRFQKVLEVDPNRPLIHYYLALVDVNQGDLADARIHLERFVELAPDSKEAATAREMLKKLPAKD